MIIGDCLPEQMHLYVGFNFMPTDQILLEHYLFNKLHGLPYSQAVVFDCDLYGADEPWQIWKSFGGVDGKDLYFFTKLKRSTNHSGHLSAHISRKIGLVEGTWSGENSATSVFATQNDDQIIGYCKRFRYENKQVSEHDGEWIMHEYSLHANLICNCPDPNYVLCRIRKNERPKRKVEKECLSKIQPMKKRVMAPKINDMRKNERPTKRAKKMCVSTEQRDVAPQTMYNMPCEPEKTTDQFTIDVPYFHKEIIDQGTNDMSCMLQMTTDQFTTDVPYFHEAITDQGTNDMSCMLEMTTDQFTTDVPYFHEAITDQGTNDMSCMLEMTTDQFTTDVPSFHEVITDQSTNDMSCMLEMTTDQGTNNVSCMLENINNDFDLWFSKTTTNQGTSGVPYEHEMTTYQSTSDMPYEPAMTINQSTSVMPYELEMTINHDTSDVPYEPEMTTNQNTSDVPYEPEIRGLSDAEYLGLSDTECNFWLNFAV